MPLLMLEPLGRPPAIRWLRVVRHRPAGRRRLAGLRSLVVLRLLVARRPLAVLCFRPFLVICSCGGYQPCNVRGSLGIGQPFLVRWPFCLCESFRVGESFRVRRSLGG